MGRAGGLVLIVLAASYAAGSADESIARELTSRVGMEGVDLSCEVAKRAGLRPRGHERLSEGVGAHHMESIGSPCCSARSSGTLTALMSKLHRCFAWAPSQRTVRKNARTSSTSSCGCSMAAK